MTEDIVTRAEFNGVKDTIIEIKADIKETNKEVMGMLNSEIRTEMKLEAIVELQKRSDAVQASILISLKEIKDKPFIEWNKVALAWKIGIGIAVIGFFVPYILGNYVTFDLIFK